MAAEFDSPEFRTLRVCTAQLETALKGLDRNLIHFLNREGFIKDEVHDHILNPVTMLRDDQKAWELAKWIIHRVKQHPPSYHVFLGRLKLSGKVYEPIVGILEAEFAKQASPGMSVMSRRSW
jgi:hypothetical protein